MHFTVTRGFHGYFPCSNIIDIVLFYIIRDQVFSNISSNLVLLFFFFIFSFRSVTVVGKLAGGTSLFANIFCPLT